MERAHTGFGKFWNVMKIDDAIFQGLESFGKERFFQIGFGRTLDFCLGNV